MTRDELSKYIKEAYGIEPDYPFGKKYSDAAVYRHCDNNKWFALSMYVSEDKLGKASKNIADIVTVKAEPVFIDFITSAEGYHRAYHMNKTWWMSIELDRVDDKEIMNAISTSFEMTKK